MEANEPLPSTRDCAGAMSSRPAEKRGLDRRSVSSTELLGPAGELTIVHAGRAYLLRVTRNGNLILTA